MERSRLTRWVVLLGLLVVAFAGTVLTLNLTMFSASGFVGSYLQALERHDAAGAVSMPGVTLEKGVSRALLAPDALGELGDIRLVSDIDAGAGKHRVSYSFMVGGQKGSSTFSVEHTGARLGLFSAWKFSTSPVVSLAITPLHDAQFDVNDLALTSKAGPGVSANFLVFSPGDYTLGHSSKYFTAATSHAIVTGPAGNKAQIDIQANKAFVAQVQEELDDYLKKCVKQEVLLPTGCPMGKQISDRIQDAPVWSMATYPVVTIVPGTKAGTWSMPSTPGVAHLKVTVKSIFDGTVSSFDQDVPFTVRYLITFPADGTLLITAQY